MARHLHTRVADDIRKLANGDRAWEQEMQRESLEYAAEVRGQYDEDHEPDYDNMDGREREPEYFCPICGNEMDHEADDCGDCDPEIVDAHNNHGQDRPEFDDPMSYGED